MGLCIELTDESWAVLEFATDERNLLHRLLPPQDGDSSPMLESIDWYGHTVFNSIQMKRFLAEWEYVVQRAASDEEQVLAARIKKLAERCRDEVHIYLKFVGD
jgi:hypothetical protein